MVRIVRQCVCVILCPVYVVPLTEPVCATPDTQGRTAIWVMFLREIVYKFAYEYHEPYCANIANLFNLFYRKGSARYCAMEYQPI